MGGQGTRAASANGQSNYQKPLTPLIFRHSRFAVHADLVMNIGTFTTVLIHEKYEKYREDIGLFGI
ncbi:TPA: hypothetical protein OZU93_002573 [Escherichia coli]|nr:hypothetical protein [Escherichia coli]